MKQLIIASTICAFGLSAYADEAAPAAAAAEHPSCGQMTASKAPMVGKFAEFMTDVADSMDAHAKWTGTKDKAAKAEHDAFTKLAKMHKEMATLTKKIVAEMTKDKDLAPVKHDMANMDPKMQESWAKTLTAQKEFLALLQKDVEQQEQMMASMKQAPAPTAAAQ